MAYVQCLVFGGGVDAGRQFEIEWKEKLGKLFPVETGMLL